MCHALDMTLNISPIVSWPRLLHAAIRALVRGMDISGEMLRCEEVVFAPTLGGCCSVSFS